MSFFDGKGHDHSVTPGAESVTETTMTTATARKAQTPIRIRTVDFFRLKVLDPVSLMTKDKYVPPERTGDRVGSTVSSRPHEAHFRVEGTRLRRNGAPGAGHSAPRDVGHGRDKSVPGVEKQQPEREVPASTGRAPGSHQHCSSVKSFASVPRASGSSFWGSVLRKLLSVSCVWNPGR